MPAEICCPKCSSSNVFFSKKRKAYVCEDCDYVLPEKPTPALRIFLSYGHDANEELVRWIKADLEKRGHDVWSDKSEIKFGDNWRRTITDGILGSNRVLSFLSKHSTRDPGVCRDEIAIAIGVKGGNIQTILVENESEVQPPVNIGHIQWLDMHDWKTFHDVGGAAWLNWYQSKFADIARVVESDESQRFAGEIETLHGHLKPIQSDARIYDLLKKGFIGRQWLFDAVENWRSSSDCGQRLFWITGDPGVGKSAFAAQFAHTRSDTVIAAQFVEWDKPDHRDARRVIRSLAFQIATRLPDYRKLLLTLPEIAELDRKGPAELFDYLLANPLKTAIGGGRERYLIVIDALDEAGEAGRNPLVELLARHASLLSDWISIVITSRPESAVKTPLQGLNPFVLDTRTEANRADLCAFLRQHLELQLKGRPDADRLIGQILVKSEGVFLYVERFCDDVQHEHLSLDCPEQFPQGLGGIFAQWFHRQFPDLENFRKNVRPALRAILAAREPLPIEILQRLFNWQDEELRDLTRDLGSLFPTTKGTNSETIRPYHKSLTDWLSQEEKAGAYFVSLEEGHRTLADRGWQQYECAPETMDDYFLQWLPAHLLALNDDVRLIRLLKDFRYLMAKTRRGMLERLLADFRELPARITVGRDQLEIETVFFRGKAHILRRGSDEWPAHKILLQLAVEHANDSPLTVCAEQWLADNRCDWLWLRRVPRLARVQKTPCIAVLEGHSDSVKGARALSDGRILSWSADNTQRIWDGKTGVPLTTHPLNYHLDWAQRSLVLGDGRILSWVNDETVQIWDGTTGATPVTLRLNDHSSSVRGALPMRDGRILSWWSDGTLQLWDNRTNASLTTLPFKGHSMPVNGALEVDDGQILSWSQDHTLLLWDGRPGGTHMPFKGHSKSVTGARVLSDGHILSWSDDRTLRVWNERTGRYIAKLKGHLGPINGTRILCSGHILSWSEDGTLRRWCGNDGQQREVFEGHSDGVLGALELSDGRILSWSKDFSLRLWDGWTGVPLYTLTGHNGSVNGGRVLHDGRILSWSSDHTLRLWNGQDGTLLATLNEHSREVNGALELADGRILSWSDDNTLRLWNARTDQPSVTLKGNPDVVRGALKLGSGNVLSWSQGHVLRLWDGKTGELKANLMGHSGSINGALELGDSSILSWSQDHTLWLWDGKTGERKANLTGHSGSINGALELGDSSILSWSQDKTLRLWDGKTGERKAKLIGHLDSINGAKTLNNGRILSWSQDHTLKLWNCRKGRWRKTLVGHSREVKGVLELIDGRILSWSGDNTPRLWNGGTGTLHAKLKGHSGSVNGAQMLADGRILSWSSDNTLRIWNCRSGRSLLKFEGHSDSVNGARGLIDGRILSWSDDSTLRLWDGRTGRCLETVADDQVAALHPEWLYAQVETESPRNIASGFFCEPLQKVVAYLRHKTYPFALASWAADSNATPRHLMSDGTLVVTQENGQVCFLKLYHGNRRISLAEAEALLPQLVASSGGSESRR